MHGVTVYLMLRIFMLSKIDIKIKNGRDVFYDLN